MSNPPSRHFQIVYIPPREVRRVFIDPKPQPEPPLIPIRAEVTPEPIALIAKETRRAARQRIEAPAPDAATPAPRLSGSKAEWAHAQRNVDLGSAPISLTEEQIREQNEAASRWAERAEREHNAKRARPKDTAPRSASISTSMRRR